MRVFVFLASGILEDGSVAFFSYEFIRFVEQNCFFNESVVFLASGILEDGSVAFFHMNLQNCVFSMKVLVFLASGILEDGSVAFFSHEFISFFETELFFQ